MEKEFITEEKKYLKELWTKTIKRDFSGNTGLAMKNSVYQFSTTLIAKIGGLILMVIMARILMPELFGLYNLALSTIVLFAIFSDLGISNALVRFVSKELSKKKPNTKAYYDYLLKLKSVLALLSSLILILLAAWISNDYYNKPIFFALLVGGLYIFVTSFTGFFSAFFQAHNNFKKGLNKEIIVQILRLIIIPLVILFSLNFSEEILLLNIFLALSFCIFIGLVFLLIKKPALKGEKLNKKEKKQVKRFIFPLAAIALSGVFFGYIDMIMLGHFVDSEFIGYYSAAFSLVGSIIALLCFSTVLLPIFSKLKGKRLKDGLKKSIRIIMFCSLIIIFFTLLLAPLIIRIIYGVEYSSSTLILRMLGLLIFSGPLIAIYSTYFISKGNTQIIAKLLISTTILNIILNYVLISILVKQSHYLATIGAVIATLISNYVYLFLLRFSMR